MLTTFNTLPAAGDWTLFLADLSTGSEQRLSDWSLIITGVPEPGSALLLTLGSMLLVSARRRR